MKLLHKKNQCSQQTILTQILATHLKKTFTRPSIEKDANSRKIKNYINRDTHTHRHTYTHTHSHTHCIQKISIQSAHTNMNACKKHIHTQVKHKQTKNTFCSKRQALIYADEQLALTHQCSHMHIHTQRTKTIHKQTKTMNEYIQQTFRATPTHKANPHVQTQI